MTIDGMGGFTRSINVRPKDRQLWLDVIAEARRQQSSVSEIVTEAMRDWLEKNR